MMKLLHRLALPALPQTAPVLAGVRAIAATWYRQKLPLYLFLGVCFNLLVLAPAVYATTGGNLSPAQAAWLTCLGVATVLLSIYLFFVMFVPERF